MGNDDTDETDNTKQAKKEREALPLPLTATILAGGQSRRMGKPKAFLPFEGTTMIAHVVKVVKELFQEVLIVANEPDLYDDLEVDLVKDILPNRGPMGGLLSALLVAENEYCFAMACDMPFITPKLIRDVAAERHGYDAVVISHRKGVEPLFAVYSKSCIKPLEESLFTSNLAMRDFLFGLKVKTLQVTHNEEEGLPPYFNINTPQDYSRAVMQPPQTFQVVNSKRNRSK